MKNELSLEKNTLKSKNNDWSVLNLFCSYLKRNRSIIVSIFVLPLIFIVVVGSNYKSLLLTTNSNSSGSIILMIIWLTQTASFAIQTFLTILLDLKQTIVYRRIGLTRISKAKFIFVSSVFNLALLVISDIFVFIIVTILGFSLHITSLTNSIFHWQMFVIILFTLALSITLTAVGILMSTIIKTRTGQAIASIITNLLIIAPLMVLIFFLNSLSTATEKLAEIIGTGGLIGIFVTTFIIINIFSILLYYLTWKLFKWFD